MSALPLFTSNRERRLWFWTAIVLLAIYTSLGPSQIVAEWLRERNLLRISLAAVLLLGTAIVVWRWVKTRPGWREIGVGFGVTFAYLWALARVGVPPEERTHLIEYAVVAAFIYQALVERRLNGRRVPAPDALTVALVTLLGLLDEGIQWLLPNRVFDIRDLFFNFLAGVMFTFVALSLALVRRRKEAVDPGAMRWPDMLPRLLILPRLAVLAVPLGVAAYIGFGPQPSSQLPEGDRNRDQPIEPEREVQGVVMSLPRLPYLTTKAHEGIAAAHDLADRLGHDEVTPAHLALGLVQGANVATGALYNLGVPLDELQRELEEALPSAGTPRTPPQQRYWTPGDMQYIDQAKVEARELRTVYYGCEHLLLVLLRDEAGAPAQVLARHGVRFDDVRNEVVRILES